MERVGERSFRSSKRAVFMSSPFRIRSPHCRMMQNATRRLIALQDGPVILVGHSWGGAVITEAGDDPKVVGLVYVAAFLLEAGASANQTSAPFGPTPVQKTIKVDAQHFSCGVAVRLLTCHVAMLQEPEEVADVITEAAKGVAAKVGAKQ